MRSTDRSPRGRPECPSITRRAMLGGGLSTVALAAAGCGSAEGLTVAKDGRVTVKVLAFRAPSLGAFLPAVIKSQGIDVAHDLRVSYAYATPDNYNTEFASGHYQVGGSAALLSEALRTERGVGVTYLFNMFDYFSAIVTSEPAIRSLTDLRGHSLAAATGTTNHAMFEWFARQAGLDLGKVELLNQTTAGLSTMALMGRAAATEIWEPAYSSLRHARPGIRSLDFGLPAWQRAFGTDKIPYLGLAAHKKWARAHPDVVTKLYRIYSDAATWTTGNPAAAAKVIAAATPRGKAPTLQALIENQQRLRLGVRPAADLADGIGAVFKAGRQTGYLSKTPPATIIYRGL
jgi:NitT/TauT family transport system substrate-binding protein